MAIYRDQVTRVTLPMVRAWMRPAGFRQAPSVRLEKFGFAVDVTLERVANSTSYGGERVFFVCPRPSCGARVNVVGCAIWIGWGCSKCLRWRGRNRRWIELAPVINGGNAHA
jgi:hypothetical protein